MSSGESGTGNRQLGLATVTGAWPVSKNRVPVCLLIVPTLRYVFDEGIIPPTLYRKELQATTGYDESANPSTAADISTLIPPEEFGSRALWSRPSSVAISEAHDSGLCAAPGIVRQRFASDLDNITLATPRVNRRRAHLLRTNGNPIRPWFLFHVPFHGSRVRDRSPEPAPGAGSGTGYRPGTSAVTRTDRQQQRRRRRLSSSGALHGLKRNGRCWRSGKGVERTILQRGVYPRSGGETLTWMSLLLNE